MKRRIIVILIIVAVIGVLVVGAAWYVRRNTGPKLLARAELAIRAEKHDKALGLADNYIEKYPDDWQGYTVKARALNCLGRYSDARQVLEKAAKLNPGEVSVSLTHSESYSLPAFRLLARKNAVGQPALLSEAIELLNKANKILADVKTSDDPKHDLDVKRHVGLNYRGIAFIWGARGRLLEKEAKVAEAARDTALAQSKRKASKAAKDASNVANDKAIKNLLEVVQEDASRAISALRLVELCIQRGDAESLAAAGKALEALKEKAPPVPLLRIAEYKLSSSLRDADSTARREHLDKYCRFLDDLLKNHPNEPEVKLARASVAFTFKDYEMVGQLCRDILKVSPGHGRARLIMAETLLRQGKAAEAEGILLDLKEDSLQGSSSHFTAEVHVAYALAALATGKTELARELMRTATKYNPGHPLARRYIAEYLLADGFYDQAFADAREYYKAHPDDPIALRLYVEAARRADQPESAVKAQEDAEKNYPSSPEMLLAVADGYKAMGENRKAWGVLNKVIECKPRTTEERLAVAQAMRRTGRASEAEKILIDELKRDREQPEVCFELGRLHSARGRGLQAIEQFREAMRMNGENIRYRLALARVLLNSGNLDECMSVLDRIEASNVDAKILRLQVAIFRGESDSAQDQMIQDIRGSKRAGLSLAMVYLGSGQLKECVATCLEELRKTPGDNRLQFLLGQAYLNQGQKDKCLEEWSKMLKAAPENLSTYQRMAAVLVEEMDPAQVRKMLIATPGAKRDLVDMAMGWLFTRRRDFKSAADVYSRLIAREDTGQFYRSRARMLRARVMVAGGNFDQAIAELDELAKNEAWRRTVLEDKVKVQLAAGRRDAAIATLKQLYEIATEKKDAATLVRIASFYARMRLVDDALAVCDDVETLNPNDAGSYLLRAKVLVSAGRRSETIPLFEKAISLQPGNLATYRTLARMLESEQQPDKVLEVLKRMEETGKTGEAAALFERGSFFERRGLYTRAVESFQGLSESEYTGVPGLQLVLGRAFARLGQTDRATDVLKKIPVHSEHYVKSRQMLVELAKTDKQKLDILDSLEKDKPGRPEVLVQKMRILMRAEKPADAVKAFRLFVGDHAKDRPAPAAASYLAVKAMLAAKDRSAAAELATRTSENTPAIMWRHLAVLLNMDEKIDSAAEMLPSVEKAAVFDTLLGLILSVQKGDDASCKKWADRLEQLDRELAGLPRPGTVRKRYRLLAALVAGRMAIAKRELAKFKNIDVGKTAAEELVSRAGRVGKSAAAAEAAKLLKASLAIDMGLVESGKSWATEVFKARPSCQWAAAVVMAQGPDTDTLKFLLETIKPRNCALGIIIEAGLLARQKKYEQAADVYRRAAQAEAGNRRLVFEQARMRESAGQLERALALYSEVWNATQDPGAANNAAYLVAQLYPKDTERLNEAMKWTEAAVKAAPRVAAFRDTKGWIAFLLGKKEQARIDVGRAVTVLRGSPEVHYHMGVIEADAGNLDLARWHLKAVADNAEAIKSVGVELAVAEVKAVLLAKGALSRMDRKDK